MLSVPPEHMLPPHTAAARHGAPDSAANGGTRRRSRENWSLPFGSSRENARVAATLARAARRMVLRRVLLALLSNPHLIEKLAESRPIRAAARLTASAITRGQLGARQAARDLRPGLTRLRDAFLERLKDGGRPRGWPESPGRGPRSGRGPGRSGRP